MSSNVSRFAPFALAVAALAIVAVYLDFTDESSIGLVPTPTVEPTSLPLPTPTVQVVTDRPTPGPLPTAVLPPARLAVEVGFQHTATVLADGRVLVAGGRSLLGFPTSDANVQTYDPTSGVWGVASSMAQPRYAHSATLLEDGRVLMVGGREGIILHGVEIYDPRTNIWSPAGLLARARAHHAAVRIGDGLVMVIGGETVTPEGETVTATTEIYDAFSRRWVMVGEMGTARAAHAVVAFPDGRVLASGGIGADGEAVVSAEMYSPSTGLWSRVRDMSQPRVGHTATLLPDGKVLVAGGVADDGGVALATAELYDPATDEWSPTGEMAEGRLRHTASLIIGGNVVVVGGSSEGQPLGLEQFEATLASAEVYERSTGTWAEAGTMLGSRSNHATVVLVSGQVMAVGGWTSGGRSILLPVEVLDPSTHEWSVRRQNKWDRMGAFKACNLDANRLRQFSDLPTSVRLDSFASPPVSSPVWRLGVRGTYPPA